ncbi:hypothetical protein CPB97_000449 [Podila verticillata]|nr:hypothetical protein CPB97_000449 [Podila verticillata]
MASKDEGAKDNFDLFDEELDYGEYDLDADTELLDSDLAVGDVAYDEFDLDVDELDPDFAPQSTTTSTSTSDNKEDTSDPVPSSEQISSTSSPSTSHNTHALPSKPSDNKDAKSEEQSVSSDSSFGANNRTAVPSYGSPTLRGGMGRGGYGGRSRGQPYMGGGRGMGRGSFDNRQGGMMSMNGMNMNPLMAQGMNLGMMGMNMGLGMGVGGTHYPYDGYNNNTGNRGMGYYGGANMDNMGQGMNRMNHNMGGMNARAPSNMAGRNIHINPKFQNLAGMPNIPAATTPTGGFLPNPNAGGTKGATWDNNRSSMSPARSTRPATETNGDHQRDRPITRDASGRFDDRTINSDRDRRPDSYNSHSRSDREGGSRSSDRGSNDRSRHVESGHGRASDSNYHDSPGHTSDSRRRDSRSHSPGRAATASSINSRLSLGAKRGNDAVNGDVSNKSQKSNNSSTPHSSNDEPGSVSFLRDRNHDRSSDRDSRVNAVPTGFVRMDNVPESTSDSVIRALANGISGVDRILTVSKNGKSVTLGFGTVDEAKFFRRQINRTSVEGSMVTVTLASS